ncbi:MAG: hypothetical protein IK085_01990 [Clostridia bacterium]|nr:hypothetical protein [Clostridia bacterium]
MNSYFGYEREIIDVQRELIEKIENQKGFTWEKIKAAIALECLLHVL